ncbi:MAG: 4Fe-4S binding protein [Anaerolineales bacterium]|nr:4Fe-4S binding protein [Anaerolineales bacterium]MCB8960639.1 4Fe-4S binding protein [Ardenticatenales bacterium]MCB0007351.1 4Fe-4S binding protein [Anaerolineales bacterium]MCB0014404.1 4Fe-4S binding protein [Anaerolineales bacterium]MCB0020386.1 4Fe-4S binding protein [Anaerolineales bacterium]
MKRVTMLLDVLRSLWQRPFTRRYPFEKSPAPERLRGRLHYDSSKCTGCCLCSRECPSQALELITVDRKAKRFVLRYHADRCIYCSQCVQNCRFNCLEMSPQEWELAATSREPFTVYYGDEADVATFLARGADADSGDAE